MHADGLGYFEADHALKVSLARGFDALDVAKRIKQPNLGLGAYARDVV
jgi:hypothetical protein